MLIKICQSYIIEQKCWFHLQSKKVLGRTIKIYTCSLIVLFLDKKNCTLLVISDKEWQNSTDSVIQCNYPRKIGDRFRIFTTTNILMPFSANRRIIWYMSCFSSFFQDIWDKRSDDRHWGTSLLIFGINSNYTRCFFGSCLFKQQSSRRYVIIYFKLNSKSTEIIVIPSFHKHIFDRFQYIDISEQINNRLRIWDFLKRNVNQDKSEDKYVVVP